MKILYVITRSDILGGASKHLFDLSNYLSHDHDVVFIIGGDGPVYHQFKNSGFEIYSCPFLDNKINLKNDLKSLNFINSVVKKTSPDIVHLHSTKAGFVGRLSAFISNKPSVFTAHGWAFTSGKSLFVRCFYYLLESLLSYFTDKVICVSNYDYDLIKSSYLFNSDCSTVVQNGVIDLSYSNEQVKKNSSLETLKLVSVGRLDSQKDFLSLVNVINQIDFPVLLTIIGEGPQDSILKDFIITNNLSNKVKLIGFSENVSAYLKTADVFVLLSHWEGLPLTILEAMSFSLPCVCSDVGGISDAVSHNENGFLVSNNKYFTNIAHYLSLYYYDKDMLLQHSLNSRKLFVERFEFSIMAEKTLSIYNDILIK